jgi:hypothetical protein
MQGTDPMTRTTTLTALTVAALAASAHGAITGTGGAAVQIGSPPNCTFGVLTGAPAWCWNEQAGINGTGLPVDLSTNPSTNFTAVPGVLSGLVDSHIIHFNDVIGFQAIGSVTFNNPIVGVAYNDVFLNVSDLPAGAFGTTYPTGNPARGINSFQPGSMVAINLNTINFDLRVGNAAFADLDQVRVYTAAVPAPGSIALVAAGGLVAARRRRA